MSNITYHYIPPTSEVLHVVLGLTYQCPNCDYVVLIQSREDVFGTLVQRNPDKVKLDLIFGHQCTHCKNEVTISHYLPHTFRVWMKQDQAED